MNRTEGSADGGVHKKVVSSRDDEDGLIKNQDLLNFTYDILLPNKYKNEAITSKLAEIGIPSTEITLNTYKYTNQVNSEFDKTVDKTDKIDYILAVCSGMLTAAIDILWVGEFSLKNARNWGEKEIHSIIIKVAKSRNFKGNDLRGAIRFLENESPIQSDKLTPDFGGSLQHHLRDFAHHFSPLGLIFSLISQFTGAGYGTDTEGNFITRNFTSDEYIGKDFSEKVLFGITRWFFHLISDMGGSSNTPGSGTGIPGPLLSLLKEISSLPFIKNFTTKYKGNDITLSKLTAKLFNGTFFKDKIPFDFRTELGVYHEISRQAVPVIINECLVRCFYFIRRISQEIKDKKIHSISSLKLIDSKKILPFNNRVIRRMITVSSGIFMIIDTSSAAIYAAIKNMGLKDGFAVDFLVRINFIGIGRFIFACKADSKYIAEDFKQAFKDFVATHKAQTLSDTQQNFPEIKCLNLNEQQIRILDSLKFQKILYDIESTKDKERSEEKLHWMHEWKDLSMGGNSNSQYYIEDKELLYSYIRYEIENSQDTNWLYLITLEVSLFIPYFPLNSKKDRKIKRLKLESSYEENQICQKQKILSSDELNSLLKTYRHYLMILNNKNQKVAIGLTIAAAATVATGGLAYIFAPELAIFLVGESVAGLSGAALTSASLAAVGGGSLAAGGLGIAGGTTLITGGGALLGILGSGAATIPAVAILSSKDFILNECAKLLAFCKNVLIDWHNDLSAVKQIQETFKKGICTYTEMFDSMKDKRNNSNQVLQINTKNQKQSLLYLNRCNHQLLKLIQKNQAI